MKTRTLNLCFIGSIICLTAIQCEYRENGIYKRLRNHADEIKVIDTHTHMRFPEELVDHRVNFYDLINRSYLTADLISAGSDGFDRNQLDTITPSDFWGKYGQALDYCRNTSYYGYLIRGFQKLYGFNDREFTEENIASLASMVKEKYKNHPAWFDEAYKKAGFDLMFLCTPRFPIPLDNNKYCVVSYWITRYILQASQKPSVGAELKDVYKEAADAGYQMEDLDNYLAYCDLMLKKYIDNRGVCIKITVGASRTLFFEDVPYEEARRLYAKPSTDHSPAEAKIIEDFICHWFIKKSIEYKLPIQIHTGYFVGNGRILENGHPLLLNNLFLQYTQAKFILFHGGFPWTGEFAALGKMFPNVYLDLVWLPQISREEAVQSLDVMLDCVPYNKFFFGGDCNNIEGEVGALEYGKDVVSEVLAKRVNRGLLTEETAMEIIDRIFRENAMEVFNIKEWIRSINKFE